VPDATKGLYQVTAAGGNPVLVIAMDASKFSFYAGPRFLPDGKHFLYTAVAADSASTERISPRWTAKNDDSW